MIEQNTPEWHQARCGSLGASAVHDALARTKAGWGAGRANAKAKLVLERLTNTPQDSFTNAAMQWGHDQEDNAAKAYAFRTDNPVEVCGIYKHPFIDGTHASPDRLVGDDGLVEIKCPNSATHLDTLLSKKVPAKYITQMQWQMAVTGRKWCDFVSFDPRFPEEHQLFIQRVERDDQLIQELEQMVAEFLAEVDADLKALSEG
jgi:putative phage-type endonuclease